MNVWMLTPSKRPPAEVNPLLSVWRSLGYKILLQRDPGDPHVEAEAVVRPYQGHAEAVNYLCREIMGGDQHADWLVCAGDDTEPDRCHPADEIAAQCSEHFTGTWGVMQPTGDRWANGSIDLIAGSPWMGRDFCRRIYSGRGPLWPDFFHMFDDQHLWNIAKKLGIYWMRPDLIHLHNHWIRTGKRAPAFLDRANSRENWDAMKKIFDRLEADGFREADDLLPE